MSIAARHIASYFDIKREMPQSILDIGSGSDLAIPILMARECSKVIASDVNRLASASMVKNIMRRVKVDSLDAIGLEYVVYKPPRMPFEDEAFDLITSTSVLEHVPANQIPILANELFRVLRKGGVSTHHVAHKDHWSDSDSSIHPMNYLRFDEDAWRRYNPPLLHQNRILSSKYEEPFRSAGFAVARETTKTNMPDFAVSDFFKGCDPEDLRTTHSWLTLAKH